MDNMTPKMIAMLGEAIRKTGGKVSWFTQEEVAKEEKNFEIKPPIGCYLWLTRIQVQDDNIVDKVRPYSYSHSLRYPSYFEETWSGLKATASIYLGKIEPPKEGDKIKVTLLHARIITY